MKRIPVAKHLSDQEYKLLLQVYANHNSSMGMKERVNHSISHIVKIKRNLKEKCLEVYYQNGNWWHYDSRGVWW